MISPNQEIPTYHPPVLFTPAQDMTLVEGQTFNFHGSWFSDVDNDIYRYEGHEWGAQALPSWMTFNVVTNWFSGTVPAGAAGDITLYNAARDAKGFTAGDTFIVTIVKNHAPAPVNDTAETLEHSPLVVDILQNDKDSDGNTLHISSASVATGNGTVTIGSDGQVTVIYTGADLDPGKTATIKVEYGSADPYASVAAILTVTVKGEREDGDDVDGNKNGNTLRGSDVGESLFGMAGKDKLFGNDGDDQLWGGKDNDTLTGGEGVDTFYFANKEGKDKITDFDMEAAEVIDLSDVDAIKNFKDLVKNHLSDTKQGLLIDVDKHMSVMIEGVHDKLIGAEHFSF